MQAFSAAVWQPLLELAARTPSPHNVQPWRVRLRGDGDLDLLVDGARVLPCEDTTSAFLLCAMAMYQEALTIAARTQALGLRGVLVETPARLAAQVAAGRPGDLIPFARLTLSPAAPPTVEEQQTARLMGLRRTSRLSYLPQAVPGASVTSLWALAQKYGFRYAHVADPATIEQYVRRDISTLFGDLNVSAYRGELTRWYRYDERSAASTRDGLSARCMNLPADLLRSSARSPGLLRLPVLGSLLKDEYRARLGTIPALGLLAGPFFKPEQAIAAGAFLLRFWLRLAELNLYMHPFGNLITNPKAANWVKRQARLDDVFLIFKVGFSVEPPQSYRRTVSEIVV